MPFLLTLRAALKQVPGWVWILLLVAASYRFALGWHEARIKAHDAELTYAIEGRWQAKLDALDREAMKLKAERDAALATLTTAIRKRTDEDARVIAASAADLLRAGPGRAASRCDNGGDPRLPATAGGHVAGDGTAVGQADASAAGVPQGDRQAVVPWGWLVSAGQTCDLNRNEASAWRDWYREVVKAWPKPGGNDVKAD
jgi:hypothetical protein